MTDRLRLHYAPDNASLCVRLTLEACEMPYETVLVDRRQNAQKSQAFLALNPNGLIPVLETNQGAMFETAAIIMWLCEGRTNMLPNHAAPERAHAVQWLFWLANTLHPTLRMLFYPDQYIGGDTAALHQRAKERLKDQLTILQAAKTASWLEAAEPTAQACYLGPMLRWAALYGGGPDWFDLCAWPRLMTFAENFERTATAVTCAQAEGLGPTPFSAPSPCRPPQGSAL